MFLRVDAHAHDVEVRPDGILLHGPQRREEILQHDVAEFRAAIVHRHEDGRLRANALAERDRLLGLIPKLHIQRQLVADVLLDHNVGVAFRMY